MPKICAACRELKGRKQYANVQWQIPNGSCKPCVIEASNLQIIVEDVEGSWITLGIHVRNTIYNTIYNITGVVIYVGRDSCTVRQVHGHEVSLLKADLSPVRPDTKLEMVKVLDKDYRGAVGQVLNFERMEAIVRLDVDEAGGGLVRILEMDTLVMYEMNVAITSQAQAQAQPPPPSKTAAAATITAAAPAATATPHTQATTRCACRRTRFAAARCEHPGARAPCSA